MTSESMLDPAVSLSILRLDTQLACFASDEVEATSLRDGFNEHMAGFESRSWQAEFGQNLLAAIVEEIEDPSNGEKGQKLLERDVADYRFALDIYKADIPHDWATTQSGLGAEESRKLLEMSVAVYSSVLEIRTKADLPQDWASTQNGLGVPLFELGTRSKRAEEKRKLLEDAAAAYRSALEVMTKADRPRDYGQAEHNLGSALYELGRQNNSGGRKS